MKEFVKAVALFIGILILAYPLSILANAIGLHSNGVVIFEDGTSEGNIHIVNDKRRAVQAELILKGSETVIYKSELIPAGGFVEKIRLSVDAPAGTYECRLVFKGMNVFNEMQTLDTNVVYITIKQ